MSGVVLEEFRAVTKNSLRGFCRVRHPSGLIVHEIAIHVAEDGRAWASPPARPMTNKTGNYAKGDATYG
jgi:hypothetical protein